MLRKVCEQSFDALGALAPEHVCLVLPVSSLEQHGPHLPVGTDDLILQVALDAMVDSPRLEPDFWLLPAVHYGLSPEHMAFAGTVTLTPATLLAVLEDIAASLRAHSWRHLVLLNSHGGNTSFLHGVAQHLKVRHGLEIYHMDLWGGGFYRDAEGLVDTPIAREVHGGEIETALMQHAYPGLVRDSALEVLGDNLTPLPARRGSWVTQELSESGMLGGAGKATPEKGDRLLQYTVAQLLAWFGDIHGEICKYWENADRHGIIHVK